MFPANSDFLERKKKNLLIFKCTYINQKIKSNTAIGN